MHHLRKRRVAAALVAVGVTAGALAIDAGPIDAGAKAKRVDCRGRNESRREMLRCVDLAGSSTTCGRSSACPTSTAATAPCSHEACDTSRNINRRVLHQNSDAIAFAALRYSKARDLPGDPGMRMAAASVMSHFGETS